MSTARAPLPLRSIGHILHRQLAAAVAHLLNILEADLRPERLALPCLSNDAVELVDLLEGQTFGLVDHEPDEGDADAVWYVSSSLLAHREV